MTTVELPEFKKCCLCCPGLIAWGYVKLVLTVAMGCFACLGVVSMSETYVVIPICADLVFIIIFLISAHRKDYKLMTVFYYYSFLLVFLNCAAVIICTVFAIITLKRRAVEFLILFVILILIFIINKMIQIYLTLLIRSEVLKLKNNLQCKFVKKIVQDDPEMDSHVEKVKYGRLCTDQAQDRRVIEM